MTYNSESGDPTFKQWVWGVLGFLALAALLAFGCSGIDWGTYAFWAPKMEQARRNTFERSSAYNQGMIQELENMRVDYVRTSDPSAKQALASVILHRASGYNLDDADVPYDLRIFIQELKGGRR